MLLLRQFCRVVATPPGCCRHLIAVVVASCENVTHHLFFTFLSRLYSIETLKQTPNLARTVSNSDPVPPLMVTCDKRVHF